MAGRIPSMAAALLVLCSLAVGTAWPASDYYMSPSQVDLVQILPPPPTPDSAKGKADLQSVLEAQRIRTPAEVKNARADSQLSVSRFADVMGSAFRSKKLPFATVFFQRVVSDDERAIEVAKGHFNRSRPYVVDPDVKPVVGTRNSGGSYPSGHAAFAYAAAILLAAMVPEKTRAIFDRADRFAEGRLIAGVHYPTDIEAGRISGSVIDNVLLHDPRFEADFKRATIEVRHALGLGPAPELHWSLAKKGQ